MVPTYYLASVPEKATDVALELSKDGFSQEFSFTKGEREGPQPPALYDSVDGWELTDTPDAHATLTVTGPKGRVEETAYQVLDISASLTYFLPGTGAVPPTSSSAWLVVTGSTLPYFVGSGAGSPGFSYRYTRPLTGKDVMLALPGRPPVAAGMTAASGPGGGLFAGSYYWQVPASTQVATLRVSLPPVAPSGPGPSIPTGWRAVASARPVQVNFSSTYEAPPSTVANSAGTSPATTPQPTSASQGGHVAARPRSLRASRPVPWLWLVLAVAGLIVLFSFALRWRTLLPAWPPSGRRASRVGNHGPGHLGDAASVPPTATEAASADGERRPANPAIVEGAPSGPRPLLPGVEASAPRDATALPEGAMLQMIGHVRLVRLPQAEEARAVLPDVPTEAVSRPAGPVSVASPGPPPSPMTPAAPEAQPLDAGTKGPLAADASEDLPTPPDVATGVQVLGGPPRTARSGPSPNLVPVPHGPPPLEDGSKEVQVIGKPRLITADGAEIELIAADLELLARLALAPGRAFSAEELRADMGAAKESDWTVGTLWTRASSLRRSVGAEHLPPSSRGSGYRVVGIGTDVARFEAAVARSRADPANAAGHLAEALSLVRGAPFANVPLGTFTWALDAGGAATRVANAVYAAAVELAQLALAAGGAELATWAVAQGRVVSRDDEVLDVLDLEAAAISPDRSALARSWAGLKRRYGAGQQAVPVQVAEAYSRLSAK